MRKIVDAAQAFHFCIPLVTGQAGPIVPGVEHLRGRATAEQFALDTAFWYGTLQQAGAYSWKSDMLLRLWALLFHGGLWMKNADGQWAAWDATDMPIASCLSHGGRVLVQLPPDDGEHLARRAWSWLWGARAASQQTRAMATHGVAVEMCGNMPDGRPKHVRETKGGGGGQHYGVNIAAGGFERVNPISQQRICDDGRHGHLYLYHLPPAGRNHGALLVAAEDSAPIDAAPFQGWFPKGQTGHRHTLGSSGEFSLTGGEKFKHLALNHPMVPADIDSMFVDPPVDVWKGLLNEGPRAGLTFDIDWLGYAPTPLAAASTPLMPTSQAFKSATSLHLHWRNDALKLMDSALDAYHSGRSGPARAHLERFVKSGELYLHTSHDPKSLKDVVAGYVDLARQLAPAA